MRPWIRRSILVLAMSAGLIAACSLTLFFLHRSGFVKNFVNQQFSSTGPLQFFVEDAWIDLWGPTLEIRNLQILYPKSSVPIATVERGFLDFWLNPFRGSFLGIKRGTVESARADLPYPVLEDLKKQGESKGGGSPLQLPEIWVRKLNASFEPKPGCIVTLGELSFAYSPFPEGGGQTRGRIQLPVGPEVLFSGRIDEKGTGSFVAAGDLRFEPRNTPETEGPGNLWGDLRLVGDLSLRAQGSFGPTVPGGATVQLDGVAKDLIASIPGTPFRLQKLKGPFSLANRRESRVDLEGFWEESALFVNGKANLDEGGRLSLDVFLAAQNIPLDERVRQYATLDHTVDEVWKAFEPKGRCDISLRLRKLAEEAKPSAEPILRFRGGELAFHGFPEREDAAKTGFPLPIDDLRGEILCQPGRIALHQLRGKMRNSEIAIAGALFQGEGEEGKRLGIDLQIDLPSLPLDATTREAAKHLPPEVGTTWDSLQLRGAAQLALRLSKAPGRVPLHLSGRIAPQAASMRLREFPLPVEGIEGEILLDPDRLLGRVRGKAGSGSVEVELGLLDLLTTKKPALPPLRANIRATRVPIEQDLKQALEVIAPGIGETLRLRSGLVDAEIDLSRLAEPTLEAGARPYLHRRVRAHFDQLALEPMWFPLALDSSSGTLLFESSRQENDRLLLQSVETRALGAAALFRCGLEAKSGTPAETMDAWLRAFDLPLAPDLFRAMEKAKLPAAEIWAKSQWNGAVTVGWEQQKKPDLKPVSRLVASFQDAALRLPDQGFEMREITGTLEANEQGIFSQRIAAKLGGTAIDATDLRCLLPSESPEISFVLSVPRMDLAQDLSQALPAAIATRAKDFGLQGVASVEDASVRVAVTPGLPPSISMQGPIVLRGFGTQGFISVQDTDATLWIQEGRLEGGKMQMRGILRDGHTTLFRRRIENLQTRFEVSNHALRIYDASGKAYQGRISQAPETDFLRVELLPPYPFRINLSVAEIDLRLLLRDLLPSARDLRGLLGVALALQGEYADLRNIEGTGAITIREGALWDVPVFQEVFKALTLKSPPVFQEGRVSFLVGDQKISLAPAEEGRAPFLLSSSVMGVSADKGSLDFTGNIDLELRIRFPIPILGDLIGILLSLADFRLTGPIGSPQVSGSAQGETPRKVVFVPEWSKDERSTRF